VDRYRAVVVSCALLLTVAPYPVVAQAATGPYQSAPAFASWVPPALNLATGAGTATQARTTRGEKGALIGGGLGIVVGAVAGAGLCTAEDSGCEMTAVGLGLIFGLMGAVLGALIAGTGS